MLRWILLMLPLLLSSSEDRTSGYQQQAIAELIQSLKSTRKVLLPENGGPGDSTESSGERTQKNEKGNTDNQRKQQHRRDPENPFKDKQEYRRMDPAENRHEQILSLQKKQEELNREMRDEKKDADPSSLAERQKHLRGETARRNQNRSGDLAEAEKEMQRAEAMLRSDKKEIAALPGQKASTALKRAAALVEKQSDESIRKSLSEAAATLKTIRTPDDLKRSAGKIRSDAIRQSETGTMTNARTLMKLAEKTDAAANTPFTPEKREKLRAELDELRMRGQSPERMMNERTEILRELAKQLKYAGKHPETLSDFEWMKLCSEIRLNLSELQPAARAMRKTNPENRALSDLEKEAESCHDAMSRDASDRPGASGIMKQSARILKLAESADRILSKIRFSGNVYVFNPDDVPEAYRNDVSDYFKKLSEKKSNRKEKP